MKNKENQGAINTLKRSGSDREQTRGQVSRMQVISSWAAKQYGREKTEDKKRLKRVDRIEKQS